MFYKQIIDKESLKIRNDIFIKDVVPILAKKGFIKSPFYTSCFGRTSNNGIYIYDMCRLRQCNLLEFVTTKISSRDRYIKIYVNTFALHPKIQEKYYCCPLKLFIQNKLGLTLLTKYQPF